MNVDFNGVCTFIAKGQIGCCKTHPPKINRKVLLILALACKRGSLLQAKDTFSAFEVFCNLYYSVRLVGKIPTTYFLPIRICRFVKIKTSCENSLNSKDFNGPMVGCHGTLPGFLPFFPPSFLAICRFGCLETQEPVLQQLLCSQTSYVPPG